MGSEAHHSRNAPRILIADDSISSRELLRSILESCGYEVFEAEDGERAIGRAYLYKPDLIILDLNMPKLDGSAVARQMRQSIRFESTPIIALTAAVSDWAPQQIAEAGFSGYLTKPISPASLRHFIKGILKNASK